ncbi:MAG: tRNA (5-methylaminomethyl-2-thiouridine)(34)-methyltransferase MnmD, partial [Pseudomonadota bacterium]
SQKFNDVFFSLHGGFDESMHVYVQGIDLPALAQRKKTINLVELGFGTGLNFLTSVQAFLLAAPANTTLHYTGIDQWLVDTDVLAKAHKPFTSLEALSSELQRNFPAPCARKFQRIALYGGRVYLTIIHDDVAQALRQLSHDDHHRAFVDGWYMDGFAPKKNPDMWRTDLLDKMVALSHANTKLASFSVARHFRDKLHRAGWRATLRAGFGKKRECLQAVLQKPGSATKRPMRMRSKPWAVQETRIREADVAIIGGGIGALSMACALAARQIPYYLLSGNAKSNIGGTQIPYAAITTPFRAQDNFAAQFFLQAFCFAVARYKEMPQSPFQQTGVIHPIYAGEEEYAQKTFEDMRQYIPELQWLEKKAASDHCALPLQAAIYNPLGGYVDVAALLKFLYAKIENQKKRHVTQILRNDDGSWQLSGTDFTMNAKNAVIACGAGATLLPISDFTKLQAEYGQGAMIASTGHASAPVISRNGVMITTPCGRAIGATQLAVDLQAWQISGDLRDLWDRCEHLLDHDIVQDDTVIPYQGYRCVSKDHMPLVGQVPCAHELRRLYSDIYHGKPHKHYASPQNNRGLYMLTGLGANGYSNAMFCAEILADIMGGHMLPTSYDIVSLL